jgi:hypothetical protein
METSMSEVTLYGFPRSVYVQMAGIVLTHHEVAYTFYDLETEMNTPAHLALHPFERVPILRHGDFTLYETGAIVWLRRLGVRVLSAHAQQPAASGTHEPMDQRG